MASQNVTDPRLGTMTLDLMQQGLSAQKAIAEIQQNRKHMEYRQVLAVDGTGQTAIHSGTKALGVWAEVQGDNAACGGNLLANEAVPQAVVQSFVETSGSIGDRLITALQAGLKAGGEAGPLHSAGLKIVDDKVQWPVADLRCDWTETCPIEALATAWNIYKPQLDDYIQRALDPSSAPSYGVPGDE